MAHSTISGILLRLRLDEATAAPRLEKLAYQAFVRTVADLQNRLRLREHVRVLGSDILGLGRKIQTLFSARPERRQRVLVVEVLDRRSTYRTFDDISDALTLALIGLKNPSIWAIFLIVSDEEQLRRSVIFKTRLCTTCKDLGIGLVIGTDAPDTPATVIDPGKLTNVKRLALVSSSQAPKVLQADKMPAEEIERDVRLLFHGFEITTELGIFHVPVVANVGRLAQREVFLRQLRNEVAPILATDEFAVCPMGLPRGGIDQLAFAVAGGNEKRILPPARAGEHRGGPVLILCDLLGIFQPVLQVHRDLMRGGTTHVAIAGVGRYADTPDFAGLPTVSFLEMPYEAVNVASAQCPFCAHGEPCLKGADFSVFERSIREFDSLRFWSLIGLNSSYYSAGHFRSEITPNHYYFRIQAAPLFRQHGYGIAVRLRNLLESNKIFPTWIKRIVCTEGEDSATLAFYLADVLRLGSENVIQIPRELLKTVTASRVAPDVIATINEKYKGEDLRRRNVLIIDQAAHHFKTLSALRTICENYDCTVLAFAVFVDRTDAALSLDDYLTDSHYLSLYSWPCLPRRAYECPCMAASGGTS